jgi:hypothetical protein
MTFKKVLRERPDGEIVDTDLPERSLGDGSAGEVLAPSGSLTTEGLQEPSGFDDRELFEMDLTKSSFDIKLDVFGSGSEVLVSGQGVEDVKDIIPSLVDLDTNPRPKAIPSKSTGETDLKQIKDLKPEGDGTIKEVQNQDHTDSDCVSVNSETAEALNDGLEPKDTSGKTHAPEAIRGAPEKFAKKAKKEGGGDRSKEERLGPCDHGLLFENVVDRSAAYEMNKVSFDGEAADRLVRSIKAKEVFAAGFYGDFRRCVELAAQFLDKPLAGEVDATPRLADPAFMGIFASQRDGRVALILKAPDATFTTLGLDSGSLFVTQLRFLVDLCPKIVVAPPRGFAFSGALQTPFEERMGMDVQFEEKVRFAHQNATLSKLRLEPNNRAVTPQSLSYSNDLSKMAYSARVSKQIKNIEQIFIIKDSQLQKNKSDTSWFGGWSWDSVNKMTISEVEAFVLKNWPSSLGIFSAPTRPNAFSESAAALFMQLAKSSFRTQLELIIAKCQDKIHKYHAILEEERRKAAVVTIRKVYDDLVSKLDEDQKAFMTSGRHLAMTKPSLKDQDIFKILKEHFKGYTTGVFAAEGAPQIWFLSPEGQKKFRWDLPRLIESAAKTFFEYQETIWKKSLTEFHVKLLNLFFLNARPLFASKEIKYSHRMEVDVFRVEPARTNPEVVDFVSYVDATYRAVVSFDTPENEDFQVEDVLFVDENKAFIVLKSEQNVNRVVFGRFRNKGENQFTEVTSLRSGDASLAICGKNRKWVIFDNASKVVNLGKIEEGDKLDGRSVSLFGPVPDGGTVDRVESLTILPDSDSIYFLNQDHHLFEFKSQSGLLTQIFRKENKGDAGVVKSRIAPRDPADHYETLQSSPDGKALFLQCRSSIDVLDLNWQQMATLPLQPGFKSFKVFTDSLGAYLHVNYGAAQEVYQLVGFADTHSLEVTRFEDNEVHVEGNRLFDYVYLTQKKFGPPSSFIGAPQETMLIFWDAEGRFAKKSLADYFRALKLQDCSFQYERRGDKVAETLGECEEGEGLAVDRFRWLLISRVPIHVASIDNFTLVPLRDGQSITAEINAYFKAQRDHNLMVQVMKMIGFGVYETQLAGWDQEVCVVSICGRQSSGKSYLLNMIFGTRFDVSSARCTDGIWMSAVQLTLDGKARVFVVLDCEGLFSSRRTETDEMKMCLTLTAISNATILNQDLSFSRYLSHLFQSFSRSVGRLNSSLFFKGHFMMVIRDVSADQSKGAFKELQSYLQQLQAEGKNQFIQALFSGKVGSRTLNHFEKETFPKEVTKLRNERFFQDLTTHWTSGKQFIETFKRALTQIFLDDSNDLDIYQVRQTLQENSAKGVAQFYTMDQIEAEACEFSVDAPGYLIKLTVNHPDVVMDQEMISSSEVGAIMGDLVKAYSSVFPYKVTHFNQWMGGLKAVCSDFLQRRKQLVFEYFKAMAPKEREFQESVDHAYMKLVATLDNLITFLTFCDKRCRECDRLCSKRLSHKGDCDCETGHRCQVVCDFTQECLDQGNECVKLFGHERRHVCNVKQHNCTDRCGVADCAFLCSKPVGHDPTDRHDCSNKHPCKAVCLDPVCGRTCQFDRNNPHEHNCGQTKCLHPCKLCGAQCMFPSHFHDALIKAGKSKELETSVDHKTVTLDYHVCGSGSHECSHKCEAKGVCQVGYDVVDAVWKNSYNEFTYQKYNPKEVREGCGVPLAKGTLSHPGTHDCHEKLGQHRCNQQCPECLCFCDKPIDHAGAHGSKTHRNKDKSVFVASSTDKEISLVEKDGAVRKYGVGESCGPENCTSGCSKRGRAHYHIKPCRGESSCEAKSNPSVVHSTDKFYPFESVVFDKWLCKNFWESHNWEPPLTPDVLAEVQLCSYVCGAPTHGTEMNWCHLPALHSSKHSFPCVHPRADFSHVDLAFVMDCTGSMGSYITTSKSTIQRIVSDFALKVTGSDTLRVAFVGYRDHPPQDTTFVTKVHNFSNSPEAITFINGMTADGGGDGPESVLDGLWDAATKLSWRKDSVKYVFHVADAPPHGPQYVTSGDGFPSGCPCGMTIERIACEFERLKVKYKLLKIGSYPNLMADVFKSRIKDYELSDLDHAEKMTDIVSGIIARDMVSANTDFSKR